jgi:hypothetical protein
MPLSYGPDSWTKMPTKTSARTAKKSQSKKLPACTKKDLQKAKSKRRACVVPSPKPTYTRASPTGPVAAPPAANGGPDSFPTPVDSRPPTVNVDPGTAASAPGALPAAATLGVSAPLDLGAADPIATPVAVQTAQLRAADLPIYGGTFSQAEAHRLLLRAGFGPKPGQSASLAALGLERAVNSLLNPGSTGLTGPAPSGTFLVNGALQPRERRGHLHLAWMDTMVRSADSLTERMALILHDWFGVSEAGSSRGLTVDHIELLRRNWRGSFRDLLLAVSANPAILEYHDCLNNWKGSPNEAYARELLERYALGADRRAFTELDVRETARALTGFTGIPSAQGPSKCRFDPARHDIGNKTLFVGTDYETEGKLNWIGAIDAIVAHPLHASFVALKLWSYFVPTAPSDETLAGLAQVYRDNNGRLAPLVAAILMHPDFHQGPTMVMPPVVQAVSILRARNAGITTDRWVSLCEAAGQLLGAPPASVGWNPHAWLNTSTWSARWNMVRESLKRDPGAPNGTQTSDQALDAALAHWGRPSIGPDHLALLRRIASQQAATAGYSRASDFYSARQNVLRQLVAGAPDAQVS